MTRQEAKERINNKHRNCTLHKVVAEIFDDFEQDRREQAIIRIESNNKYEEKAKAKAERKYMFLIKQYKEAHENLVNENKRLRSLIP